LQSSIHCQHFRPQLAADQQLVDNLLLSIGSVQDLVEQRERVRYRRICLALIGEESANGSESKEQQLPSKEQPDDLDNLDQVLSSLESHFIESASSPSSAERPARGSLLFSHVNSLFGRGEKQEPAGATAEPESADSFQGPTDEARFGALQNFRLFINSHVDPEAAYRMHFQLANDEAAIARLDEQHAFRLYPSLEDLKAGNNQWILVENDTQLLRHPR
jgi:hypothetical protein